MAATLAHRQPPCQGAATPLWAPCCKWVCPRAATTLTGWSQSVVPASAAPAGYCPRERRWPPLRVAALASDASLPYGLALAAADRPLAWGLGRGLAVGGQHCMGAGRPSSLLPSLRKRNKNA
ncbi:hypothetical protein GW17_00058489 [Ensete ventricosum]|nr:hypothetical protein GW17_00058489 [Ensete ventricosum]